MRERLTALSAGAGALLLFATLFLRGGVAPGSGSLPTTVDAADSGLKGAVAWLRAEGVRTLALRERFDTLARRPDLAPQGNLLIVSMPVVLMFRQPEVKALDEWIRAGNTLLVMAAMADRPAWAQVDGLLGSELEFLTDLGVRRPTPPPAAPDTTRAQRPPDSVPQRLAQAARRFGQPLRGTLVPNRPHAFFTGVHSVQAQSEYPPRDLRVTLPHDAFVLSLARARESGQDALWIRADGAGTVIVSGFASLFSNRLLDQADNARLLANIVAASVAADGAVLFDDQHQGLGLAYDPAQFYRDPRLYRTLGVIAAVWLTWVLGSTRLRVPRTRAPVPREADLVRATGLFLARVLRPASAARLMFAHFFHTLPLPAGDRPLPAQQVWEWLANHPQVKHGDVRQLHDWYLRAESGRRVPLAALHNLILRTQGRLAA